MAGEGSYGAPGSGSGQRSSPGEAGKLPERSGAQGDLATGGTFRTHLFSAQHADRYARQGFIREYEVLTGARLIVMIDTVFAEGVTYLEELLVGCRPDQPLHLLLASPGGDGEVAVRLVRAMQARCSELTIIVPDMAKSAATIMCLGADHLLMQPSSDLGPVDPQFQVGGTLVGAKEIEQAVSSAEARVAAAPDTYPLYAGLLADVNMLMVEQARLAMARSYDLIREALVCAGRDEADCEQLADVLRGPLVDEAVTHGATVGPERALQLGLPVLVAQPESPEWQIIWALWTRYFALGAFPAGFTAVYEGAMASQVIPPPQRR